MKPSIPVVTNDPEFPHIRRELRGDRIISSVTITYAVETDADVITLKQASRRLTGIMKRATEAGNDEAANPTLGPHPGHGMNEVTINLDDPELKLNPCDPRAGRGLPNTPLQAKIQDGVMVIAIGIETLRFCSEEKNGGPIASKIVSRRHWAADVIRELTREAENGETVLTEALENAMERAASNGSIALLPNCRL